MNDSRLKKAMRYQLYNFVWSCLYVYGIAIAVIVAIGILVTAFGNTGFVSISISGVGFFHLLIVGITWIREDFKFFIQHGISRRTTFFSHLYVSLIGSALVGVLCEFVSLITNLLLNSAITIPALARYSFFSGWLTHTIFFFFAWQIGALLSLIYYRLNKIQQVVFSVTVVATIVFGGSYGVYLLTRIADDLDGLFLNFLDNTLGLTSMAVLLGLVFGILAVIGNYLLLRRVQIKE